MKRLILVLIFTPLILFSQKTDVLKRGSMAYFKGISLGFLVQGQTKYPSPYNGPEVRGLFNDCLLYTSPSPRDVEEWGMAASA